MSKALQLSLFKGRRQRGVRPPLPLERKTHIALADALRVGCAPGWEWNHFPSGEKRSEQTGALLKRMGTGLVVTEVMGQGVSTITGDYSRGAAGFWVENGAIAYPVEEITIAANLRDMYANIVAVGSDVDHRSHLLTGSILLEQMTIAGE